MRASGYRTASAWSLTHSFKKKGRNTELKTSEGKEGEGERGQRGGKKRETGRRTANSGMALVIAPSMRGESSPVL